MIKEAGPGLVGPLVSLVNASLRLRKVPDEWRKSIIKPIFKGGRKDRRDPSSYRPIALTSCVARTMEKVLNARILEYLQKFSLLYEHQSGFQRNHSTISQLCFLAHQWTALDGGKNVQSVFLDLSKAYDRVSIPGLLSKLSLIGFSSSATEWFASFLTHTPLHPCGVHAFFFFSSLQEMSRRETACCCFLIGFCWYASGCYFFVYFLSCQESLPRSAGKKGIQFPSPHSGNWIKKTKTENKNINSFWYVHEFSWLLALKNFFCLLDFFFVWDWNSGSYVCHLWWWL